MRNQHPSRLAAAGSALLKLNIGDAAKALTAPRGELIDPLQYRGTGGLFNFLSDGGVVHFSWGSVQSAVDAYKRCSPLAAIINKKVQAYNNGRTYILDDKGKVAETAIAKKVRAVMDRPNPLQTWKQLDGLVYLFKQLFGYCVVLKITPVGFPNEIKRIWVLPPHMCDIRERSAVNVPAATSWSDFIERIDFTWGGWTSNLSLDTLFLFRDISPSMDTPSLPESRVRANQQVLNNIIGAYESRGVLIDKRGPSYVISSGNKDADGTSPMEPSEKDAVEQEFSKYGLRRGQMTAIISTAALQVATIGFSTKELMLFEEIEDDIMRLCDTYGYPYQLMASNRTNSLGGNNIGETKQQLYQDAILPEAEDQCAEWTQFFGLTGTNLRIDKDFKHVAALQADNVKEATARKMMNDALKLEFDAGLITLDGWLVKLGEDPLPDGRGKVYSSDLKNSNVPLAMLMPVGAFDGLINILTAQGIDQSARQATLEILFGLQPADAARMVVQNAPADPVNPITPQP